MRSRAIALDAAILMLSIAASCTPQQPEQPADTAAAKFAGDEYGRLERLNVTNTQEIDSIVMRGTFRNPYDEPVEGIRILLRVTEDSSPTSRTLTRAQNRMETRLEPGASVPFAITAKFDSKLIGTGMFLAGFAVRRGDQLLPLPPLWEE